MMEALLELIKTATSTLTLLNAKLERELVAEEPIVEAPARRGRKPKEPAAQVEAAQPEIVAPQMTEDESKLEVYNVAKAFTERFKSAVPSGLVQAQAIIAEKFAPAKQLKELNHAQRIKLIGLFKEKLEAA